jgi:hypothetical protein
MTSLPDFPSAVTSFDAAADAALDLADRFRRAVVAVLLDRHGTVMSTSVHLAADDGFDTALASARSRVLGDWRCAHLLAYSVDRSGALGPAGEAIGELRRARGLFAGHGVTVIDWIQVAGTNMRSVALLGDRDRAWPDDLFAP